MSTSLLYEGSKSDVSVELIEAVVRELDARLAQSKGIMSEDLGWAAINTVLREKNVQSRVELLTPIRHALTGRKVSLFRCRLLEISERRR